MKLNEIAVSHNGVKGTVARWWIASDRASILSHLLQKVKYRTVSALLPNLGYSFGLDNDTAGNVGVPWAIRGPGGLDEAS
jgi:hypothetical protein